MHLATTNEPPVGWKKDLTLHHLYAGKGGGHRREPQDKQEQSVVLNDNEEVGPGRPFSIGSHDPISHRRTEPIDPEEDDEDLP